MQRQDAIRGDVLAAATCGVSCSSTTTADLYTHARQMDEELRVAASLWNLDHPEPLPALSPRVDSYTLQAGRVVTRVQEGAVVTPDDIVAFLDTYNTVHGDLAAIAEGVIAPAEQAARAEATAIGTHSRGEIAIGLATSTLLITPSSASSAWCYCAG